jgi:hypothetical protein
VEASAPGAQRAASQTPAKDAAAAASRPVAAAEPAPAETVEYAVFEVLDAKKAGEVLEATRPEQLLVRHATVTVPASGGRPAAIAEAIKKNATLRQRVDEGEEIALLPITARLVKPEVVKVKVERSLQIGGQP